MSFEPGVPASEGAIPLCVPEIRGNEWVYLKECLDTNFVSSVGPFVDRFERELAVRVGTRCAVATVNGTAALHIALLVGGIQPDDEVLVSSLTFIAPVNAIRYVGAWPVYVDAEPGSWQMDPDKAVHFLERGCLWKNGRLYNKTTGRRVRAILPVHILGHPVNMAPLVEAARKYDLLVMEDATESLGAQYRGTMVGHLGDVACFSFNGNKLITTGGGGMLATDNEGWARRAKYLTTQAKDDPVEFVHGAVGYNYRLTNIQAAMGCAQLEQLDEFIAAKRRIAEAYAQAFREVPGLTVMPEAPWAFSVFWLFTIQVDAAAYGMDSRALLRCLQDARIQARPLWLPAHQSPVHQGVAAGDCSVAERLNRDGLSLPCSVGLTASQQQQVCAVVRELRRKASGHGHE